jgi:hypothetical protein
MDEKRGSKTGQTGLKDHRERRSYIGEENPQNRCVFQQLSSAWRSSSSFLHQQSSCPQRRQKQLFLGSKSSKA